MSGGTQILGASYAACGWRTPADNDHTGGIKNRPLLGQITRDPLEVIKHLSVLSKSSKILCY